jgi:dTDP-4-dehydrorhamnose 3,5-epimerase
VSNLLISDLPMDGLKLIQRAPISDNRGFFSRLFCTDELNAAGWKKNIQQINHTKTIAKGSIRGMHYQKNPFAEMKMVSCLQGEIYDVVIDLRPDSSSFLQWHGEVLSSTNKSSLIIPEGFAHGFQALTPDCELIYFHSAVYNSASEAGLNFQDPKLSIQWPIEVTEVSERDRLHKFIDKDFKGA